MPIFTFVCDGCARTVELVCKVSERDACTELCTTPDCPNHGDVLKWRGVEGSQVTHGPKYQFALKDSAGNTVLRKPPDRGF